MGTEKSTQRRSPTNPCPGREPPSQRPLPPPRSPRAASARAVVALTHSGGTRTVTVAQPQTLQVSNVSSALSVADLAKKVTPSVVEIVSTTSGGQSAPFGQSQGGSQSEGTGWVYDTDGHIVTNEHVVDGASSVKVTFSDGSTSTATIVGKDISTDLAVIKVNVASSKLHAAVGCELEQRRGRSAGRRDRQPVRPAGHGDERHRQRAEP